MSRIQLFSYPLLFFTLHSFSSFQGRCARARVFQSEDVVGLSRPEFSLALLEVGRLKKKAWVSEG
jgi:hypothetical protein